MRVNNFVCILNIPLYYRDDDGDDDGDDDDDDSNSDRNVLVSE